MYQFKQIPSESQINTILKKIIFEGDISCPKCGSTFTCRYENRFRCKNCRTKFSLLSSTLFAHLRIPLSQFWLILWCWTSRVPIKQTALLSGLSIPTIYHWFTTFESKLKIDQKLLKNLSQVNQKGFDTNSIQLLRSLLLKQQPNSRKPLISKSEGKVGLRLNPDRWLSFDGHDSFYGGVHLDQTHENKGALRFLKGWVSRLNLHMNETTKPWQIRE